MRWSRGRQCPTASLHSPTTAFALAPAHQYSAPLYQFTSAGCPVHRILNSELWLTIHPRSGAVRLTPVGAIGAPEWFVCGCRITEHLAVVSPSFPLPPCSPQVSPFSWKPESHGQLIEDRLGCARPSGICPINISFLSPPSISRPHFCAPPHNLMSSDAQVPDSFRLV